MELSAARVSVIVPAYNAERFICEALDSVRAQTLASHEIIVIDDGSSDGTARRVETWSREHGTPVRIVRKRNGGVATARNSGLKIASGDFIALLDADDILLPDHHRMLVRPLLEDPALVLVFGNQQEFDGESVLTEDFFAGKPIASVRSRPIGGGCSVIEDPIFNSLIHGNYIPTSGTMLRAATVKRMRGYDETLATSEDREFLIRLSRQGRFAYTGAVVARKRLHPSSLTEVISPTDLAFNALFALAQLNVFRADLNLTPDEARQLDLATERALTNVRYSASKKGLAELRTASSLLRENKLPRPTLRDWSRACMADLGL